jgi:hypothetical protein
LGNVQQQTICFCLDHRVALAAPRFNARRRPIKHHDVTATVVNQGLLKLPAAFGHTLAAHTEHVGDQFLRHRQFVRGEPDPDLARAIDIVADQSNDADCTLRSVPSA